MVVPKVCLFLEPFKLESARSVATPTDENADLDKVIAKQGQLLLDAETRVKIQAAVEKAFTGMGEDKIAPGITVLSYRNCVFKIDNIPGYVIKATNAEELLREKNRARKICLEDHLDGLYIPKATIIEVTKGRKKEKVLVEEELFFAKEDSVQEQKFLTLGKALDNPIRDLTTFICKDPVYRDIEYRNNPILDSPDGKIRIGLLDIEYMATYEDGIVGMEGWGFRGLPRGLLASVSEEHVSCIVDTVQKVRGKALSSEEIAKGRSLRDFYRKNKIRTGREPVSGEGIDFSSSSFPPRVKKKLCECLEIVIKEINHKIQKAPEEASIKDKRWIKISTYKPPLSKFATLWLDDTSISDSYLYFVLKELCKQRIVHSEYPISDPAGYFLQA